MDFLSFKYLSQIIVFYTSTIIPYNNRNKQPDQQIMKYFQIKIYNNLKIMAILTIVALAFQLVCTNENIQNNYQSQTQAQDKQDTLQYSTENEQIDIAQDNRSVMIDTDKQTKSNEEEVPLNQVSQEGKLQQQVAPIQKEQQQIINQSNIKDSEKKPLEEQYRSQEQGSKENQRESSEREREREVQRQKERQKQRQKQRQRDEEVQRQRQRQRQKQRQKQKEREKIKQKNIDIQNSKRLSEKKTNKLNIIAKFITNSLFSLYLLVELILPEHQVQCLQEWFLQTLDNFFKSFFRVLRAYYHFYNILVDDPKPKSKKIYYPINFANLHGGAKIIMKSSQKIKSVSSILEDGVDKYMYTDEQLPIKLIIGLNEEVALESIIIQSYEMYSCITKEFKVEGKFTMEQKKWVYLGTFKAENIFGDQEFYTERKIVRYIKITINSSYGKWSYFTLTQIKIRGKGLFADALTPGNSVKQNDKEFHESDSHKEQEEQEEERPHDMCDNQFKLFKPLSQQPHESNLISSLITKIDNLQNKNIMQSKQMEYLNSKLKDVGNLLINKTQENKFYEQLLQQYREESNKTHYVLIFSLGLSGMTLICLICLCLIRRKQLIQIKIKERHGIKKINSLS